MFLEMEKNKDFFPARFGNKNGCSIFAVQNVGDVAQSVEQRTENPCVGGSIPSITTSKIPLRRDFLFNAEKQLPPKESGNDLRKCLRASVYRKK